MESPEISCCMSTFLNHLRSQFAEYSLILIIMQIKIGIFVSPILIIIQVIAAYGMDSNTRDTVNVWENFPLVNNTKEVVTSFL